jgi:hypothetical protein
VICHIISGESEGNSCADHPLHASKDARAATSWAENL